MTVYAESTPIEDKVCIGVEMERGMVTLKNMTPIAAPPADVRKKQITHAAKFDVDKIKGVTIWDDAYQKTGVQVAHKHRGVSMVLETPPSTFSLPTTLEYVTKPYIFGAKKLETMRSHFISTIKAKREKEILSLDYPTYGKGNGTDEIPNLQLEITKQSVLGPQISASIQTTVGVAVCKLTKLDNLRILVRDADKLTRLCSAIHVARASLFILSTLFDLNKDNAEGYFLACLMHSLERLSATHTGLRKDWFGANFKGFSSFKGCGVVREDTFIETQLSGKEILAANADVLEAAKKSVTHIFPTRWLNDKSTESSLGEIQTFLAGKTVDVSLIGKPNRSLQVISEGKPPIANFLNMNHLYTVVESREAGSALNEKMRGFLREEINGASTVLFIKPLHYAPS